MPLTYQLIASNIISVNTTNITFSSIPNTYTDLLLRVSARSGAGPNDAMRVRLNSLNSNNSYTDLRTQGNTVSSATVNSASSSGLMVGPVNHWETTNTFSDSEFYIPNYNSTSAKQMLGSSVAEVPATTVASESIISVAAGLNTATSAITSLLIQNFNGQFFPGSSFYLYGIKNS